jgi:hypothetical protein
MNRRLLLGLTIAAVVAGAFGSAPASQAAPGSLRILVVANNPDPNLPTALTGQPGVSVVDTFDSSLATPSEATLASYDLIAGTGDSNYDDQTLYGNRLANYIDAGGALVQFAYDNWNSALAHPTGRFESGGYPPFIPGPNDNDLTSLGTILVPNSPLLAGVPSFTTNDNVTDALAPGATLLALWADGRNAIATKGRVVSVTASPEVGGDLNPISAAAQLVVNAGNVLGRHTLTVKKSGPGSGTVTSAPAGINCGASCAATFLGATSVTLTAKAKKSAFGGWSGVGGCTKSSTCTFTPTANTTVTAKFKCKKKKHKRSAESAKKKKCKKKKKR